MVKISMLTLWLLLDGIYVQLQTSCDTELCFDALVKLRAVIEQEIERRLDSTDNV